MRTLFATLPIAQCDKQITLDLSDKLCSVLRRQARTRRRNEELGGI